MSSKFTTKTSNPDPVYVTERDGQRVRVWSADPKLDHVIDDDVRAWLAGKLTVTARSGLEFLHRGFISKMIARGDLVRDDRDAALLVITDQVVARYQLPALSEAKPVKQLAERVSTLAVVVVDQQARAVAEKRAAEKALADAELLKKGIDAPSPVDSDAVLFYVDDARVGCGERVFLVRDIGPKVVRLFYAPLLIEIAVDRLSFDRHAKPYKIPARRLAAQIERNQSTFFKTDVEYSVKATAAVVRELARAA